MKLDLVQSHRLLREVPPKVLEMLTRGCQAVRLAPGEVLLSPGQENHTLYFLLSGRVQVHLDSRDSGNSFAVLPGEVVGEMSIIEDRPVSAWVVADQASELLGMPERVFWEEFVAIPHARRSLLQSLISRVRKTDSVLVKELERKARYEHLQRELESAGKIQTSILPTVRPLFPLHSAVDTHAVIRPAREVGGDFFDAFALNEHRLYVAVGDVSGKGMPAALFMVRALTVLRMCLLREPNPAAILPAVNRLLCEANEECMFVSLAVGLLDTRTGKLIYLNGGHNPPLLATRHGPFEVWDPPKGMLMGINPQAEFRSAELTLGEGDTLVLYTDGVSEAENAEGLQFGLDRMRVALSQAGPPYAVTSVTASLEQALTEFTGGVPQGDDITLLTLQYRGEHREGGDL